MAKEDLIPLKKGNTIAKDYWNRLTPEEREAKLQVMKVKRDIKKQLNTLILAQSDRWLSKLNNAAEVILNRAIEEGDTQAFIAIYDRLIGKPKQQVDIDENIDSKIDISIKHVD